MFKFRYRNFESLGEWTTITANQETSERSSASKRRRIQFDSFSEFWTDPLLGTFRAVLGSYC